MYNVIMKTGVISLSTKQHRVLDIINKAIAGFLTVREAAETLGLSERQIQRKKKEVNNFGPSALIHKNKFRKPSHSLSEETSSQILTIKFLPAYEKVNFRHFRELLSEHHNIEISYSALYRLFKANNLKSPKTKRRFKPHRRRKRRSQAGLLLQVDATTFAWFGDGVTYALHGAIDDATSQITGLYLCKNECMLGYFEMLRRTIMAFGCPASIYADRHTIFFSPNYDKKKMPDAPANINANDTQFGRALSELGIGLIAARSPQAKGRIERLWDTLQSRLPVEFAIRGITDVETANIFLKEYVYNYNSELAVEPADAESAFLPLRDGLNLDCILCVKEGRTLDNGHVFSYHGKSFKLADRPEVYYLPPRAKVTILASPRIGIKAAYKNLVFETVPCLKSQPKRKEKTCAVKAKDTGVNGIPWMPGLVTYAESMEILKDIFLGSPKPLPGNGKREMIPY
jgi:transposase